MNRISRELGFSFVELLAALAIMGLLASVAIPFAETTKRRQKEIELRSALRDIRSALDAYKAAANSGRIAVAPGQSGFPATLQELTDGVNDLRQPGAKLFFLRRIPRDPFHPDPKVPAFATWGLRSYESPPDRPRAGADFFDVYSLSSGIGANGIPYREW